MLLSFIIYSIDVNFSSLALTFLRLYLSLLSRGIFLNVYLTLVSVIAYDPIYHTFSLHVQVLKETLLRHGFTFESDTDTEVIPKLAKYVFDQANEGGFHLFCC